MPNIYEAPYLLSPRSEPVPEGMFTVPVCTTPERFDKIMNALFYYGQHQKGGFDFDHLIDWLDACNRITEGCVEFTNQCRQISLNSSTVEWFPENPYSPDAEIPEGYPSHPFTIASNGNIADTIITWGLGYKIGDIFTDLAHAPDITDPTNFLEEYSNMPRFRVKNLVGKGTLKVDLLSIPFGGRIVIVIDDFVDILNLQGVDTDRDASFPPENVISSIITTEITTDGAHHVDYIWYPTTQTDFPFVGFGGGVRSIELCGFGVETMPEDPCCPDTNDKLQTIIDMMKSGMSLTFNAVSQPPDLRVDCTPDGFSGNDGDTPLEAIAWLKALCLALVNFAVASLVKQASNMNATDMIPDIIALGGFTAPPDFTNQLVFEGKPVGIAAIEEIVGSENGFNDAICLLKSALSGKTLTFQTFKNITNDVWVANNDSGDAGLDNTLGIIKFYAENRQNFAVFARSLSKSKDDIDNGSPYECPCFTGECDPSTFDIIAVNAGTVVTRIDATHWHVTSTTVDHTTPDPGARRWYRADVRDSSYRCFNHATSTQAVAAYAVYDCDGIYHEGVGGGGGSVVQSGWTNGEYVTDPVVGIDTIIEIICP